MDKKNVIISAILIVIGFVAICVFGVKEINSLRKMTFVDISESLPEDDQVHAIVLSSDGYNVSNDDFRVINGELYISLDYVNSNYAEERFFFDENDSQVIYTTSTSIMNCAINKAYDLKKGTSTSGSSTFVVRYTDTESKAKQVYVNADAITNLYDVEYAYTKDTNVLILQEDMMRYLTVLPSEDVQYLKVYPEERSFFKEIIGKNEGSSVYHELSAGDQLVYYGEDGDFYKVADAQGVIGYVAKSAVGEISYEETQSVTLDSYEMPEEYRLSDRISVIWEYFGADNDWFDSDIIAEYEGTEGALTVIAPTWLHVWEDEYGTPYIQNSINTEYLAWAHEAGYKVWVTLENVDNYFENIDEDQYLLFSDTTSRQAIVQQILEWYEEYGFDGINIDLESIEERLGPYFVQFMRELSAVLRPAGCMVTTDLNVPTSWNGYYRHDVMGQVCDYVCLMAYDEHYSSDTTAGSVASFPFVQAGVQDSLTEGIPAEKLVLCMPLYTRIWYLDSTGYAIPDMTRTVDMTDAWEEVTVDMGIEPQWDSTCCQYYAEWITSSLKTRTWLEDTESMQTRIDLAIRQNLGGVALWNKGRDTQEIWDLIREYLEN